jgi:photosystem II stability/assembly factor-like uncharacterized protein
VTAAALVGCAASALAHDPSAWGGLFRSRDDGAAWLSADAGLFVGAALALAVSPTDADHLLYATDTRLLRSRNAGRDWTPEAPALFQGPTLALAFARDGNAAWAATPAGVFACDAQSVWRKSEIANAALPARALVVGAAPGRVYLLGSRGVYASADHGQRFVRVGQQDLPDAPGRVLLVLAAASETLFVVTEGRIWTSADQGRSWAPRDAGLPNGQVEMLAEDRDRPDRLWAAGGRRVYSSDDLGTTWRSWGQPIAQAPLSIRGLATARGGTVIVLTTHKGLLRSADSGATWAQIEGALPVHLEAGPLLRDPHDAQTLYAGFSLVPFAELRRRAEQGTDLLSQLDPISVAGAAAFLLLLLIGGAFGARKLAQAYRDG